MNFKAVCLFQGIQQWTACHRPQPSTDHTHHADSHFEWLVPHEIGGLDIFTASLQYCRGNDVETSSSFFLCVCGCADVTPAGTPGQKQQAWTDDLQWGCHSSSCLQMWPPWALEWSCIAFISQTSPLKNIQSLVLLALRASQTAFLMPGCFQKHPLYSLCANITPHRYLILCLCLKSF